MTPETIISLAALALSVLVNVGVLIGLAWKGGGLTRELTLRASGLEEQARAMGVRMQTIDRIPMIEMRLEFSEKNASRMASDIGDLKSAKAKDEGYREATKSHPYGE